MKDKKYFFKICPKCANNELPLSNSFTQFIAPVPEICKKCGYSGLFPEIEMSELKKFKEKIKSKK
jgi:predicted nucleic-acid-binding Zn-ribbon protein